jgi:hypothetical protein
MVVRLLAMGVIHLRDSLSELLALLDSEGGAIVTFDFGCWHWKKLISKFLHDETRSFNDFIVMHCMIPTDVDSRGIHESYPRKALVALRLVKERYATNPLIIILCTRRLRKMSVTLSWEDFFWLSTHSRAAYCRQEFTLTNFLKKPSSLVSPY